MDYITFIFNKGRKEEYMLLTEYVEVKITRKNIGYYKNKGYNCELKEIIKVKTLDLQPKSDKKVKYKCDKCGKIVELKFEFYIKKKNNEYSCMGDFCYDCRLSVRKEYFLKNKPEEYKKKNQEIAEKRKKVFLEKYGVDNPMKVEEIKLKGQQTNLKRYGFKNPMQNPEIFKKVFDSMHLKENFKIYKGKDGRDLFKCHGTPCSKNQVEIFYLYGGELNAFVENRYIVDILLDNKVYFEYDGGGHNLNVKTGKITQEEFDKNEKKRYHILKRGGYKQFKLISLHHRKLPEKEVLLSIKEIAENF